MVCESRVPLEHVITTAELTRRASRPPEYELESRALAGLMAAMANQPDADTVLQKLKRRSRSAARILRESGATLAQMKIGIRLALRKSKPAIADELGIKLTSVADLTRKLYQALDAHNAAELAGKIWLGVGCRRAQTPGLPVLASRAMTQANYGSFISSSGRPLTHPQCEGRVIAWSRAMKQSRAACAPGLLYASRPARGRKDGTSSYAP